MPKMDWDLARLDRATNLGALPSDPTAERSKRYVLKCPSCGHSKLKRILPSLMIGRRVRCSDCGHRFEPKLGR